jgi:tetratricopeptide (TPR) repeat protein
MSDTNTLLWMSLELDPGTAGYFGLPERVYVPASASTPFLAETDRQVTLDGLARALEAAGPHAPEQAGRFEVMRFLSRWPRYAALGRYLRVGNATFARQVAAALIEEDPRDPPALGALAVLAARQGRWEEARTLLTRALEEAPSHAPTALQHALALAACGDRAAALLELDPLTRHPRVQAPARLWKHEIEAAPPEALAERVARGIAAFQALQSDDAADEAWAALRDAFPENPEALLASAISRRVRDDAESEALLRRAIALDPALAPALTLLAEILSRTGRTAEALALLTAAEPVTPADPIILAARARMLEELGRLDEALATYRAVFEHPLAKVPASAMLAAGDGLLRLLPPLETRRAFDDALAARPDDAIPHLLLARLDARESGAGAAEHRLRLAIRACGPLPALQYALGDILAQEGRRVEAEGIFRVLTRRHPRSAWGYRGLGDLALAPEPDRALVYYAVALALDPWTPIPAFESLRASRGGPAKGEPPPV